MTDIDKRFYELRNAGLQRQLKALEIELDITRQQYVTAHARYNAYKAKVNSEVRRLVGELKMGDIDLSQWELK